MDVGKLPNHVNLCVFLVYCCFDILVIAICFSAHYKLVSEPNIAVSYIKSKLSPRRIQRRKNHLNRSSEALPEPVRVLLPEFRKGLFSAVFYSEKKN